VRNNALKLLKLINNLLDLAKIEEKFLKLHARNVDIAAQLQEIIEHARPLAARKQITVQLVVSGSPSNLWVDPEKFERVVVNLISNALKFTEPGGAVTVEVRAGQAGVDIAVSDTGIGIPADKLDAIFERFSQADASTTRRFGGTGIGLAFAKEIMELHGGSISVHSVEGKGSTFTVHLLEGTSHLGHAVLGDIEGAESAVAEARDWSTTLVEGTHYRFHDIAEATERRIAERGDDSMKSTKVLVVEDTVELLRFIHLQLQESHAVYLAVNGRQGLELAIREAPDVIVTDYMMPEMDGVTMISELRKDPRTAEIPIIMLTAKNAVEDRLTAHGAGADVYLNKPFSPRELRTIIEKLLEKQGRQVTRVMTAQVKSLEVISAGLAHELHNPLSYIKNSQFVVGENVTRIVEALRNADLPEAERASVVKRAADKLGKMVSVADRGIRRIEDVVQLVRRYAREGYPEDPVPLAFDAAVTDVVELVAPKSDQNVAVSLALDAAGASVLAIPEEMQQVIRNLVQNAIDAVGETGNVKVSTRLVDRGRSVELEVTDDGPGIPSDVLPRIFTPFFSTKGPGKGMGVGLAIALQVVQKAGGMIDARNNPGKGATFLVRLPTSIGSEAEAPAAIAS
jgi:signal transduction histidine kinase